MRLFSSSHTRPSWLALLTVTLFGTRVISQGIEYDPDNEDLIKKAARKAAEGMVSYYNGDQPGQTPGVMPYPYYWWLGGAMFGALVDYYYYTGDDTWNNMTTQALLWQAGPDADYKPMDQSHNLGNDDQAFWAMAALSAAENKFPDPPKDQPQWLALAQAVFNEQVQDWEKREDTCGGGLMWQIFEYNPGYNYKNAISNGCFFNIASRLAMYTKNDTYAHWAEKAYNWTRDIGLLTESYQILDGAFTSNDQNCTKKNNLQWTYNMGVYLLGAANMYTYRGEDPVWRQRVEGIMGTFKNIFFNDAGILAEVACEPVNTCNDDQQSFKAYAARWMAATVKIAPFTADTIMPLLRASAVAAAKQCSGPDNACGLEWTKEGAYDGITGLGEQMSAVEVFLSNMIQKMPPPANEDTGTSKGDPGAGSHPANNKPKAPKAPSAITAGDRAGAGILTALMVAGVVGGVWWVVVKREL